MLNGIERIIIAHNPVAGAADASTRDVLAQVELVSGALTELGLPWSVLAATRRGLCRRLAAHPGTLVFNLVEAPPGDPAVHPGTAAVLELLGLPFTGSSAATLWLTTDKLATRALLVAEGLPIAPGGALDPGADRQQAERLLSRIPPPWIVKPACEDASLGLEGAPIARSADEVLARIALLAPRFPGQRLVVEQFLSGRELNVSLLARGPGRELEALPVAEIEFEDWPADMPRMVGYEAKWEPESFAYVHTVRRFPAAAADGPLVERAGELALAAARACGLTGYGRVDLRLDDQGEVRILEVNANPCLAADAGFMSAAERAGMAPAQVVSRILASALHQRVESAVMRAVPPLSAAAVSQPAWRSRASRPPAERARRLALRRSGLS